MLRTGRTNIEDIEPASSHPTPPRLLEGYPTFAEFIARDNDATIYRKFESLSARNLLYKQSELHELERRLEELDWEDARDIDNEEAQQGARLWEHFRNDTNARAILRRELQEKIETKIKAYRRRIDEAMILESKVLTLNAPTAHMLKSIRTWFTAKSLPTKPFTVLWGRDKDIFKNERDLVVLAPVDSDRLNIFLKSYLGWFFRTCMGTELIAQQEKHHDAQQTTDLVYFPERRIQRAGAVISVFLSAILLIGAIVCLLQVSGQSNSVKVGMIVLFTCVFAGVIGLLTNARRAEIFGSTAAYAAVLVVFVSNDVGNG
ncbi:hypothetical protein MMC14_004958 [Varicellaria rhodocarpa]|nr:hypothetical protein [Varicellaria rhodocarpa]